MSEKTQIQIINDEINKELTDPKTTAALLATTFKGLDAVVMKQAIMEGMIRGFSFKNFLQKDVYALPFGKSYSLITSIDFARKIGMRNGIIGKDAPVFEMGGDKIISCTVTVKKAIGGHIGDFTATVFFDEYSKDSPIWKQKPRTMIAKVAEMHALRMACPEELSKQYIEDEIDEEKEEKAPSRVAVASTLVEESKLKMKDLKKNETKAKESEEDSVPPWRAESVASDSKEDGEEAI